ncbi:B12-binding domain-containing radical SAM protein [Heliorestis convoluta]|uniref:B12-binding domain-containing radical SAM protein n=1 Tax=Heliorestis convoluta TaxID=356322 RepID=A0A5Q2N4C4_9FIRM|nr:cobalamin-dependent protein [Heliorestis convoluta]QGG47110.1 B12-binding domain-containing radical SAM protein [Heliorestis convoluta]
MKSYKILLIGLYNNKALGVRYLSSVLQQKGYEVDIIYFKDFNSLNASSPTEREYHLLLEQIKKSSPDMIGLSVMSSFYIEVAKEMSKRMRQAFPDTPFVWGGVYATLIPDESLNHCDYLMRGECEEAIIELVEAFQGKRPLTSVANLTYRDKSQKDEPIIINELQPLHVHLDTIPFPDMGGNNMAHITGDKVHCGDPLINSISYELSASRGCPYVCSYCSSLNMKRLYKGKGPFVRQRSVENTMAELRMARSKMKNLRMVWFWDEIFADDEEWVQEFVTAYKKEINLPFNIWGHPLKIKKKIMDMLVDAGLHQIVVGLQHGSPRIRKEIYFRPETDEQIIEMSRVLSEAKVPEVIFDLILDSPFESVEDLEMTYHLCMKLHKPFKLQMHGLHFLPGTDIEKVAVKKGVLTWEELKDQQNRPIEEQYRSFLWWTHTGSHEDRERAYWKIMIYLTQFGWTSRMMPLFQKDLFKRKPELMNILRTSANGWNLMRRASRKALMKLGLT